MTSKRFLSVWAMIVVAGGLMAGCGSQTSVHSLRSNPSPELHSTALTADQHANRTVRALDNTTRQIWDDVDGLMFWDRSIRLSSHPIP